MSNRWLYWKKGILTHTFENKIFTVSLHKNGPDYFRRVKVFIIVPNCHTGWRSEKSATLTWWKCDIGKNENVHIHSVALEKWQKSLKEKFKPCLFSHLRTPDQSLGKMLDCLFQCQLPWITTTWHREDFIFKAWDNVISRSSELEISEKMW